MVKPSCWRLGEMVRAARAEVRSCLSRYRIMGVWPTGAQVRRWVEMRKKPLLSRKARWAPSRRALLYRRPLVALPARHGLVVAFDGPWLRHLAAPAQAA